VQIEMTATDGVEYCETVWFYLWKYSVRDCSRSHVAFVLCCLIVGEQKWTDKEDIGLQMRFFVLLEWKQKSHSSVMFVRNFMFQRNPAFDDEADSPYHPHRVKYKS
jgi:hypothetical protein